MKLYLAGPMRGYPEFNFPAFHEATAKLRAEGHEVFSPAENDLKRYGENFVKGTTGKHEEIAKVGFDIRVALGEDLAWICAEAEAVALMPGWINSAGARAEASTAYALGLKIIHL
jgi:Domain of unknown function (DUF4406)